MEAEASSSSSRNGGFISDKVTQVVMGSDEVGLLGLKLQRTESYPYKSPMTLHHQRSVDGGGIGGGSSDSGGPSFCSCRTDVYEIVGGVQPFNTGRTATSAFKSSGIMGGSTLSNFPFTVAQWQELERQALIFKHMMASIPVPPDLLLPISRNLSNTTTTSAATSTASASSFGRSGGFNMRYSSNTDPEPGRCRRTDGKKWRCSRDVAPDQKYCERHMHRGRPRSRKHVEVQSQITTTTNNSTEITSNFVNDHFKAPSYATMAASSSPYYKEPSVDWMLKGGGNQDLQQLVQMKLKSTTTTSSVLQQNYKENMYDAGGYLFLNNELGSFEEQKPVRQFIDAWSSSSSTRDNNNNNNNNALDPSNKSSISGNGKFTTSSNLSLSMSGSNSAREIIDQTTAAMTGNSTGKSLPFSWMNPNQCLASSPPGGPLGEVLQSSNSAAAGATPAARGPSPVCHSSMTGGNVNGLNLMTDNWGGAGAETGDSPRAPAMSSPSGVLQRTLASLSDSSGGSSPTFAATVAAAAKSETGLQQLRYSK